MAAERKEKYWGEAHNAARREAYQSDPELAETIRQRRRESYRRNKSVEPATLKSCLGNVAKVASSGALLAVRYKDGKDLVIGRVFTQTDVAKLLDRQPQVIYRWHQRGIFPSPSLVDDKGNTYYADAEVTAFVTIIGQHQQTTPHYRADHDAVREALFAASFDKNASRAQAWINEKG
ncbi:hypothetical protein J2J97_31950 (plasmid) [Rhizobium bangladeshense]|uniref:hypothetical protein n=1 Tax=Rhizobium bangladeshense TaxID=1138189 RepID=UPI001A995474|nr:hypothetical protein [Rhizobium bangladeshense]QSY98686.1 hypothetical protein J2J97_31950 [Rhizobium bangladeshense]